MIIKDHLVDPVIKELTLEDVKHIQYENIQAFTYASPGAMGSPGEVVIAYKDIDKFILYKTNLYYGTIKGVADSFYKGFYEAFKCEIDKFSYMIDGVKGWKLISLGMGNSLNIREQYYNDFCKLAVSVDIYCLEQRGKLYRIKEEMFNLFFNDDMAETKAKIVKGRPSIMGAIIGDIVGSRFEFRPIKSKDFDLFTENDCFTPSGEMRANIRGCKFTDDTVMTLAVAKALKESDEEFSNAGELAIKYMKELGKKYPFAGYGFRFNSWLNTNNPEPYNSYGNGSAMRISAVPYFGKGIKEINELAVKVTEVTHNHPEGIKGACAVAECMWIALTRRNKKFMKEYVEEHYYNLDFDYEEIKAHYKFDETCQGSVPQSIYAFLISDSFEDTIRTAISMGGDADTMAAIAGAIAGAYYGVPDHLIAKAKEFLTKDLLEIVEEIDGGFTIPENKY